VKAIKVRLYPTSEQRSLLNQHFGACRFIYNAALDYKIKMYKDYGIKLSKFDIVKEITDVKQDPAFSWLNDIKAEVLQNTIDSIDSAYKSFFRGGGYPKFKHKRSKQSFLQKQNFKILDNTNKISFLKNKIKFKCSERDSYDLRNNAIKRITYSKDTIGNYYASVLIEFTHTPLSIIENEIGIDLGLSHYLITSDGEFIANPKFFKNSEHKLKKQQRKLSRKQKGSNNKKKQQLVVGRIHNKIKNQREYFLHNVSSRLINENQVISLETLSIKNMIKNRCLSKSIQDASWAKFVNMLTYKAEWSGREIRRISRFAPSSKTCSSCSWYNTELTLKDRTFNCIECGHSEDRDLNASKNILKISRDELTRTKACGDQLNRESVKQEVLSKELL